MFTSEKSSPEKSCVSSSIVKLTGGKNYIVTKTS